MGTVAPKAVSKDKAKKQPRNHLLHLLQLRQTELNTSCCHGTQHWKTTARKQGVAGVGPRAVVSLTPPMLPTAQKAIQRSLGLGSCSATSKQVQSSQSLPQLINNRVTVAERWLRLLGYRINVGGVWAEQTAA